MVLIMNEAFLIFSPTLTLLPKKYYKKWSIDCHAYLEFAAIIAVISGFLAIYINKDNNNKPHFVSWHGLIGVIVTVLVVVQLILGVTAKYSKYLPFTLNMSLLKLVHVSVGIFTAFLAIFSLVSGCSTKWLESQVSATVCYFLAFVLLCTNGFTSLRALSSNSRIKYFISSQFPGESKQ